MILALGSTGNIGRELVRELNARAAKFRVLVRDPARAAVFGDSVGRVIGDLDAPATLGPAFDGVDQLFLLVPGIGLGHTRAVLAAAQAAGVRHIVQVSSFNVLGDPIPAMGRWHHEREAMVPASGIPATILRPGGFMSNALEWAPTIRTGGTVIDPTGPGRYGPIDPADIAAVAAVLLTDDGHRGGEHVLTGAQLFTIAEQVAVIGAVIGRDIAVHEPATPEAALSSRYPRGVPTALAEAILQGFAIMRADTVGLRTDTVRRLLGRAPRTFVDWCARNIEAFR